jgi:Flp pilus assembly protein TadD
MNARALPFRNFPTRLLTSAVLPAIVVLGLAGCASKTPQTTGSVNPEMTAPKTAEDFEKALVYWGQRYAANSTDRTNELNYAAALMRTNRTQQAVAVLEKAAVAYPNDREVTAAFGKALAANGDLNRALQVIQRAQTPDQPDWALLSAQGAILDQLGRSGEARKLYDQAITIAPDQPSILSNLGMSYVLTGELPKAEATLRKAIALPGADSRIRQNLALAVGLQGRFDEAEKIASAEISPDQAAANVAYLKSMLTQQNSWQKLKTAEKGSG